MESRSPPTRALRSASASAVASAVASASSDTAAADAAADAAAAGAGDQQARRSRLSGLGARLLAAGVAVGGRPGAASAGATTRRRSHSLSHTVHAAAATPVDPTSARSASPPVNSPIGGPPPALVPRLTIAILVVGTRGDVQPFCAVGLRLRDAFGHRVRVAAHAIYRDFVESMGLEFYPLAGNPKELSAFMVKTKGSLFPNSPEQFHLMAQQPERLAEIVRSTWPACTAPDPAHPRLRFSCDAIIANPVCWGHFHCAEALSVPLHIMFPQPWSPTRAFPHPLACLSYSAPPSLRNKLSYSIMDRIMWAPMADAVNCFRRDTLRVPPIRVGEHAATLVADMRVPMSYMWSPSLCPKAADWGDHITVIGNVFLDAHNTGGSTYQPSPELAAFLADRADQPIFIGFGSMVIANPVALTRMIVKAAVASGTRVLIQSSWSSMTGDGGDGDDGDDDDDGGGADPPANVFFLGPAPHDWLLPRMAAVIHHGGAGTTAAGLRCGKPTMICPFFGDQHFWGQQVCTAGVGLPPCPIEQLTEAILATAFAKLAAPLSEMRAKAERMARQWREGARFGAAHSRQHAASTRTRSPPVARRGPAPLSFGHPEDGVTNAVNAFHAHLPLHNMHCDVTRELMRNGFDGQRGGGEGGGPALRPRVARWIHVSGKIKVCDKVLALLTRRLAAAPAPASSLSDWRKWGPLQWGAHAVGGTRSGAGGALEAVVDGWTRGVGALLHETVQGVADIVRQPILYGQRASAAGGSRSHIAKEVAKGTAHGLFNAGARAVQGVAEFGDNVVTGYVSAATGKATVGVYKQHVGPLVARVQGQLQEQLTSKPRRLRTASIVPEPSRRIFGSSDESPRSRGLDDREDYKVSVLATFAALTAAASQAACKRILVGRRFEPAPPHGDGSGSGSQSTQRRAAAAAAAAAGQVRRLVAQEPDYLIDGTEEEILSVVSMMVERDGRDDGQGHTPMTYMSIKRECVQLFTSRSFERCKPQIKQLLREHEEPVYLIDGTEEEILSVVDAIIERDSRCDTPMRYMSIKRECVQLFTSRSFARCKPAVQERLRAALE